MTLTLIPIALAVVYAISGGLSLLTSVERWWHRQPFTLHAFGAALQFLVAFVLVLYALGVVR